MKKTSDQEPIDADEMLPEYDFSAMENGVRGRYYQDYRAGHTVKIHKEDGAVEVHYFTIDDGAIMLEPDVQQYFADSQAVNNALRSLIALIPEKRASARTK